GGLLARLGFDQHAHDVAFLHDQEFDAVDLDLGSRPLAEQHAVADLDVDRDELAALVATARAHGDDLALLRFFLGGVGDDDAAGSLCFGIDALDHDTIVLRTEFQECLPRLRTVNPSCWWTALRRAPKGKPRPRMRAARALLGEARA